MTAKQMLERLTGRGIVICVGPGGVGKTTVSALLGLFAAGSGKRAVCVTVDPSERLAESLGLKRGGEPKDTADGTPSPGAGMEERIHRVREGLDAIVIHGPWVIDRAMSRYVPSEKWDIIRGGRIYHYMRHTLRGLHELASMVLVSDLMAMKRWDVVIVDTAPSSHAIDFLDMPRRIVRAIRSPAVGILMGTLPLPAPGRRLFSRASWVIFKSIGKMVGLDFLSELSEFLLLNKDGLDNLCDAADGIRADMEHGGACIVQVTSAEAQAIDESLILHGKIRREGFSTRAFVVNRVMPFSSAAEESDAGTLRGNEESVAALKDKLDRNLEEMRTISLKEEIEIRRLRERTAGVSAYLKIPLVDEDVFDLPVLSRLVEQIGMIQ
jgi:anion-transporting  ArsA/GET3 family ATPase